MPLYVPVYKKMTYSDSVLIRRTLPGKGNLVVKENDDVVPFNKIARVKVSKEYILLDPKIKLTKGNKEGTIIYEGESIGKTGLFKKITAQYNGVIEKKNGKWVFAQEKKDTWVLSGAWGKVEKVVKDESVTIRAQTVDINFVAYAEQSVMGELVVFPNPTELLDMEYLEKFSGSTLNKVIYIGHHIRKPLIEKAKSLGIGMLIGGSIDYEVFNYARSFGMPVAVTTGFGKYETPRFIFDFLKTVSNRHVLIDGNRGVLQIPMPKENYFKKSDATGSIRMVQKGLQVLVLEKNHFGQTAIVEGVQDNDVRVKLDKSEEVLHVKVPNIFALI